MFFRVKKCGHPHLKNLSSLLVRTGQTPFPLTADVFYGRPLRGIMYKNPGGHAPLPSLLTHMTYECKLYNLYSYRLHE